MDKRKYDLCDCRWVASTLFRRTRLQKYCWQSQTSKDSDDTNQFLKSSSSQAEPETTDEKNYRTAKLKLEHPYTESSEEQKQQVAQSFDEAMTAIRQAGHLTEVKGTLDNHLSMSQESMIQTLAMALLVNQYSYQSSQLEVMKSDNDDVVQFLIVLTKTGEDNCYFVGNFNTTVNQIQLKNYVGGNIGGTFGQFIRKKKCTISYITICVFFIDKMARISYNKGTKSYITLYLTNYMLKELFYEDSNNKH